ncbi:NUDIX domain-containing protein [Photorhabdus bodei]|uniref:NUDIX domain-containing protein n=1 Tax=Photorhabdus bodei TaxID=2029681 RepID=A0AAW6BKL3_9GAMM|nr:NUDIX domain-containing protein [Photorhabdus bodei]MDB6372559.1 NUDIX domain-containing protein [Photorhabdus bodei]
MNRFIPKEIAKLFSAYDRIVVGGIIRDPEGRVLFLKRSEHEFLPNVWEIPSGGIENAESIVQGLTREIKEETNLNLLELVNFVSSAEYKAGENKCIQVNFEVKCEGTVKLSDEHSEYSWAYIIDFKDNLDDFMMKILQV